MRISDWSSDVCSSDLCEIDLLPLRADALRIAFERGELILEDHFGIVEQAPDQRGFAVINRTAGQKPQHRLRMVAREIRVDIFRDQLIALEAGSGRGQQI